MKNVLPFFILITFIKSFGQTPIDVAESTIKVSAMGEETFYYGFAEGDQMVFSFQEVNGKELKELEILELPSSSKFMDYKTKKIENKTITISRTGIYKFRFSNTALAGRICKFKIQRIPAKECYNNFNCGVSWKTVKDTTYKTVQEKYLVRTDTIINNITDQVAKVHSTGNMNGNKTTFNFSLPDNTVAWSYYVGVDQQGQEAFNQATKEFAEKASPALRLLTGNNPLVAVALNSPSYIAKLQSGEDIDFYIVTGDNVNLFMGGQQFRYIKKGKVINDFSKMENMNRGNLHFCFYNDNAITGVAVTVKITAIVVNEEWGTRPIQKMEVSSRQVPVLNN